jgi:hypothetical protein
MKTSIDLLQLSEDEFMKQFPLVFNHLNPTASWACDNEPGCMFETFGEEFEFVRHQASLTVWTLVDGDDDDLYILGGLHFCNRIGYFVSTVPRDDGLNIEVHIARESNDCTSIDGGQP